MFSNLKNCTLVIFKRNSKEFEFYEYNDIFMITNEKCFFDKFKKIIENPLYNDFNEIYIPLRDFAIHRLAKKAEINFKQISIDMLKTLNWVFRDLKRGDFSGIETWDTSKITEMVGTFCGLKQNVNISSWNVSNVIAMSQMFKDSSFNYDISKWNVSNVRYAIGMFEGSKFNQNISTWNFENLVFAEFMFKNSDFNKNEFLPKFNYKILDTNHSMFYKSKLKYKNKFLVNLQGKLSEIFPNVLH